ncbi:formylmethanofuran dehydrogenase subunit E [Deinococcus reticulitermitis]|uniref:Formylmethanofuran dehydrogenase subunit E n=1 Tax=Deinococcus reticulitermitis TaxID=856736 RepID=A0A1H6ZUR4_9DEIO|nr:FmdE family protein [Deinococcus reticulitermitis]SEJ55337.1 formylmethanofuran dehydrogenase subunit E [Deinococcus reticulitermitis]
MTAPPALSELLARSAALHGHLCPRQILGVRMALLAGERLGLDFPRTDKRVLVFVETDGCFADGVSVGSGCWLGRRTLRLIDHGKVAATFVDTRSGQAVRASPQTDLRARARAARREGQKRYQAYLDAYQSWPAEALFDTVPVALALDLAALLSSAGKRAVCDVCAEEIVNERELQRGGQTLCRGCAGDAYVRPPAGREPAPPPEPVGAEG